MSETAYQPFKRITRSVPKQVIGEALNKPWADSLIPFTVTVITIAIFASLLEGYLSTVNLGSLAHQFSETAIVVLAMGLVVMVGGIDLSVGSIFALANFVALYLIIALEVPVGGAVVLTVLMGAGLGAVNGLLCGILRMRAFIVTLVTMIIFRGIVSLLLLKFGSELALGAEDTPLWSFLGYGSVLGLPTNTIIFLFLAVGGHVLLTRTRLGAHIIAVGGSRLAARRAGIPAGRIAMGVYVLSGALCALAAVLYASRIGSVSYTTGKHLEILVLTAVILGGVSLGGGRGSIARMVMGALVVMVITNGMVRLGIRGGVTEMATGAILLFAILFDVKWLKHKDKLLNSTFVCPVKLTMPPLPDLTDKNSPYAVNDRLRDVEVIGLDQVDGPEDVILDRAGNLYTGVRQGEILRFLAPDYTRREVFARPGGRPLGLAFDRDDNLITCVAGMGLYGVRPDGEIFKLTDQSRRTWWRLRDDSRILMADDLDIAPDGRIFFSEATVRYALSDWIVDGLEAAGNGKLLCYDPATQKTTTVLQGLLFANGVCLSHDGHSILVVESWGSCVQRHWINGPKKGTTEPFIANLPGFADNINRASDGTYWIAIAGIRSPLWDLTMKSPGFRTRMIKRIPRDEWIFPNLNAGFIAKVDETGQILDVLWDRFATHHPSVTSMREHRGYLYIGGLANNRIGRIKLPAADPTWMGQDSYWGTRPAEASEA